MREISIKALYKSLSKEIQDLPFAVTKKGEKVAIVSGLDKEAESGLDQKVNKPPGIMVLGLDEIIDDIEKTSKILKMSPSEYLVNLHAMKQSKKYPDSVRGSNVARETEPPFTGTIKSGVCTKESIPAVVQFNPQPKTGKKGQNNGGH